MMEHARHEATVLESDALLMARCSARHHDIRASPTVLGAYYLMALVALWVLNLADLLITMHWTGSVGWAAEGNAILRHVAAVFGTWGFVVYKMALMTLVVLALWWLYQRFEREVASARVAWQGRSVVAMRWVAVGLTGLLLGFYVWVVWNNLRIVGLVG